MLDWMGVSGTPNWRVARPLGGAFSLLVALFFVAALIATGAVLVRTIFISTGPNLGAGALIAAILGAPFLIWGTVIKHTSLTFQKEGHITDRISKAVEHLGAEKTVDRIGRPVTIWTGQAERISYDYDWAQKLEGKPRTKIYPKEWDRSWNHETEDVDEGYRATVSTWPSERTIIQWQGETVSLDKGEEIGVEGEWRPFSETVPNIEVRIGGLLSLERIAQDSTIYDKGRDHVRVMEILCAYVRENAKAAHLKSTPTPFQIKKPRIDIQTAMKVIKDRSDEQVAIEAEQKYRLDLRSCDLDGCDLSHGKFAGALMQDSRFEGAKFAHANLSGANLRFCLLNFASFRFSCLKGTGLDYSEITNSSNYQWTGTTVVGVSVIASNIPAFPFFSRFQQETFGSKDTVVNDRWKELKMTSLAESKDLDGPFVTDAQKISMLQEAQNARRGRLTHFIQWSPYEGEDQQTMHSLRAYRKRKGLIGWPYED
ncbi:MAG: pentapeptide repeat-containing protein [Paracoccaceae bacterium]